MDAGAVAEARILRKLNWAILPPLCVMIGWCYLDRSNIAYMQLQLRRAPPVGLSFGPGLYGNAAGLFFLSYSLLQVPSTFVVARVGAPVWLAGIMALWGAAAAALAAVRGPAGFLVLRLLLGAFEAGTFPAVWYHLLQFYPLRDITVPMAATASAIMLSQVLSAPLAAALMALHGAAGLQGWQWIALAEGCATVAVGGFLFCLLPRTPADIAALSKEELALVQRRVSKPPAAGELLRGVRCAANSRALWHLTVVFALKSFALFALIFWTPLVISDLLSRQSADGGGIDGGGSGASHELTAVLLTAIPYTCAAVTAYMVGLSSHACNERRMHVCVPFAIGAAVLLASPLLQGPNMTVPAFIALVVALSFTNSTAPLTATVPACLPPEAQAGGLALYNSVAGIGSYCGPAAFGWLKGATGSNAPGMVVMGVLLLGAAALLWAFDEDAATARARGDTHTYGSAAAPLLPGGPPPAAADSAADAESALTWGDESSLGAVSVGAEDVSSDDA